MAASAKSMRVTVAFQTEKTDLVFKIFKLPIEKIPDVRETKVTPLSESLSKMVLVSDGFKMDKGGTQPFLMVAENPTAQPKYFFAVFPTIAPEQASLGFGMECLCNNHLFEVPPHSRWTRVGSVTLMQYARGNSVRSNLKIVGMSLEEIQAKGLSAHVFTGK